MISAHSYLLKTGFWEMSGLIEAANGVNFQQKGNLVITHQEDIWLIEGQVSILENPVKIINNHYEVTPFSKQKKFTEWKSHLGGPEPIYGLFVIVEDAIMSPWQSSSGKFWGQEVLIQVSDDEYRGRGFSFLKNEKVSAWSSRLIRQS